MSKRAGGRECKGVLYKHIRQTLLSMQFIKTKLDTQIDIYMCAGDDRCKIKQVQRTQYRAM